MLVCCPARLAEKEHLIFSQSELNKLQEGCLELPGPLTFSDTTMADFRATGARSQESMKVLQGAFRMNPTQPESNGERASENQGYFLGTSWAPIKKDCSVLFVCLGLSPYVWELPNIPRTDVGYRMSSHSRACSK